jgi:hypothetical protein
VFGSKLSKGFWSFLAASGAGVISGDGTFNAVVEATDAVTSNRISDSLIVKSMEALGLI